ncbi:MAG: carboxyl transferase domain-containing protein [Phototrophicaceae bacterium]
MPNPDPYHLNNLQQRLEHAKTMGGDKRIARQHAKGLLTARERITHLLDEDTFDEIGQLAHSDLSEVADKTPADGKICGYGEINQRTVYLSADDATVMAGAGGRVGVGKQFEGAQYAIQKGYPIIHLGDGGGARIPDIMGSVGMMSMVYPIKGIARNRYVPQITTIMGVCYGGPSWTAAVSDVVIQVKGSIMAVAGPSILEIATGESATPEELGGWQLHAEVTGQVDLFAEDDADCLRLVRDVLSYLPSNANQLPPSISTTDDPHKAIPAMQIVPEDAKTAYDMHDLLTAIFDPNSLLEFKPHYDGSLITALARLDGHVVGVLANNPMVNVGAMGYGACEKATSFITMCDSFHIPLIFLHDTPGFFVGIDAEQHKMPLKIMTYIQALQYSTVPKISLIVRKSYGMAHCNMMGGNMGADALLAWSIAEVSFMDPRVAVNVMYGRKLQEMDDSELAREQYIQHMRQGNAIWEAAGMNYVDKVIKPDDSRRELIKALRRSLGDDGQHGRSDRKLANWARGF